MPKTDRFRQYAQDAMHSAFDAPTDEARRGLLDLERTWTQAALIERQSIGHDRPAETATA
jgi:hypothetical protein